MAKPETKHKIAEILRKQFPPPENWVHVRDGFRDYIHVAVISDQFSDLPETEKLDRLWGILDHSDLSEDEKHAISVILPYSPVEIS